MDKWVDLHTHSSFSDGSLTPSALVAAAQEAGLAALALTDHDTCGGVEELLAAGEASPIETAAGVEVSVEFHGRTVHVLGYGIDPTHERLCAALLRIVDGRNDRNVRIIRKLQMLGIRIDLEDVEALAGEQVIGRPHIAQVLVQKGVVGSFEEAFARYLGRGQPGYCERFRLEPEAAIALIAEAGGLAVLAHPSYMNITSPDALAATLDRLKQAGLAGIEAYYTDHTEEQTRLYLEMAEQFDLLVTGGTDFHGSIKPGVALGWGRGSLRVPYVLFERLRDAMQHRER
ncbi:hypothetical protein AMJ85_02440 [candidate division BRC1 bacterium SM23_51]|nr:MAG: hypothetical protein AMJ85_02440 [candidate division BRC1 bacterium SM23_51]